MKRNCKKSIKRISGAFFSTLADFHYDFLVLRNAVFTDPIAVHYLHVWVKTLGFDFGKPAPRLSAVFAQPVFRLLSAQVGARALELAAARANSHDDIVFRSLVTQLLRANGVDRLFNAL